MRATPRAGRDSSGGIALLIVLAPILWLFTWTEGETIYTTFDKPSAAGDGR